jgi:hypothetical protein
MSNALSAFTNIQWTPKTLVMGVVTTLLGALLTVSFGWIHNVGATAQIHGEKIARLDERTISIQKSVDDIKGSQLRIEDKLDRTLEKGKK